LHAKHTQPSDLLTIRPFTYLLAIVVLTSWLCGNSPGSRPGTRLEQVSADPSQQSYRLTTDRALLQNFNNAGAELAPVLQRTPEGAAAPEWPRTRSLVLLSGEHLQSLTVTSHKTQVLPTPADLRPVPDSADQWPDNTRRTGIAELPADVYPPHTVTITPVGSFRGLPLAILEFVPLQISRADGKVYFHEEIVLSITSSSDGRSIAVPIAPSSQRILAYLSGGLPLPEGIDYSWHDRDHLLILTPDTLQATVAPLATWKRQSGFEVTLEPLSSAGVTATEIHNYIQNAYDTWERPPTHVILAGDTVAIPTYAGERYPDTTAQGAYPTDLYYGILDGPGDALPDVFIGRLPGRNAAQIANMAAKIIQYERPDTTNLDWRSRGIFVATQDPAFHTLVESTHRYAIDTYFKPNGLLADSLWAAAGYGADDIADHLNAGAHVLCYSGHGHKYTWDDVNFSGQHIDSLDSVVPLVMSFGCEAGAYGSNYPSLGEAFLLADSRGAVSFWGASWLATLHEDDYLERRFWDAAFSGRLPTLGEMTFAAQLQLLERGYPIGDYYFELYNLLGDPTLAFRMGPLNTMTAAYRDTIPSGATVLAIQVSGPDGPLNNGWASISQGDSLLAQGQVYMGAASLVFQNELPGSDTATVTITSPGYRPFSGALTVSDPVIVTISPDSVVISQLDTLSITLTSVGGAPVIGSTVRLAGWGLPGGLVDITDENGQAGFIFTPPYGERLAVRGVSSQGRLLFESTIPVTGGLPFSATLTAGSAFLNTVGFLVPGFPGELAWQTDLADTLYLHGPGIDTLATVSPFTIVPVREGPLHAALARPGYNLATWEIPVHAAAGDLAGVLLDSASNAAITRQAVFITSLTDPALPAVEAFTDSLGGYQPAALPVGRYRRKIERFGYRPLVDTVLVKYGVQQDTLRLAPLQRGSLAGSIMDANSHLADVQVWVRGQNVLDTTLADGAFDLPDIVPGDLRLTVLKAGFAVLHDTLALEEGETISGLAYALTPGPTERLFTFEQDSEGFLLNGDWAWGEPGPGLYLRGPLAAYEGQHVVGTVLDGDFSPLKNSILETPPLHLDGFTHATLTFYHYYQMGYSTLPTNMADGGNVKISTDGKFWNVIDPVGGYPVIINSLNPVLAGEPGFSGPGGQWEKVEISLDPYIGTAGGVKLRFHFASTAKASTPKGEDAGWYIDQLTLTNTTPSALAENTDPLPRTFNLRQNYPNPFNSATTLTYDLPWDTYAELAIYDINGRELVTLASNFHTAGAYRVRWRGQDAQGRPVASGIYFVLLRVPGETITKKLVLLK